MIQPPIKPVCWAAGDRFRGKSPVILPRPPLLDLDFVGRPSLTYPGLPALTFARADAATCATYRDANGVRQTAAANVPRFDHDINGNALGLLQELPRTNFLLNSTAPATQTTGALATGDYILWCEGSGSAAVAGAGATITGAGTATEGSPVNFTVTVAGTVTVTKTGTLTAFQLEDRAGAAGVLSPTSLLVTTSATVTRGSEQVSMASISSWFNANEGTLFAEYDATVACRGFEIIDSTDNENVIAIRDNVNASGFRNNIIRVSNAATYQDTSSASTGGLVTRSALAYQANNVRSAFNGVLGALDTSAALPVVDRLRIGFANGTGQGQPNGHIRRLTYWPRRLPDSLLQALTS